MTRPNINDVCDYIIHRATESGSTLNVIKLQKLLYYVQAWKLAFDHDTLFDGKFQAWVHGPVNREIYDRFAPSKSLYSSLNQDDILDMASIDRMNEPSRLHIESVLEAYMPYTGTQLEEMTHKEDPWIQARGTLPDHLRCTTEISEVVMGEYYRQQV